MIAIQQDTYTYFEFSITAATGVTPLISLGIAADSVTPLNALTGSCRGGVGLYSDCRLLMGGAWISNNDGIDDAEKDSYNSNNDSSSNSSNSTKEPDESSVCKITGGCTVGILVYIPSISQEESGAKPLISYNLNGSPLKFNVPEDSYTDLFAIRRDSVNRSNSSSNLNENSGKGGSAGQNLNRSGSKTSLNSGKSSSSTSLESLAQRATYYPAVSILSENTNVWCRFCESDVFSKDLESIGLSKMNNCELSSKIKVYCLDGSLLLEE